MSDWPLAKNRRAAGVKSWSGQLCSVQVSGLGCGNGLVGLQGGKNLAAKSADMQVKKKKLRQKFGDAAETNGLIFTKKIRLVAVLVRQMTAKAWLWQDRRVMSVSAPPDEKGQKWAGLARCGDKSKGPN